MGFLDKFTPRGVSSPDMIEGRPDVQTQYFSRAMVLYHLSSVDLYMLVSLDGPVIEDGSMFLGCGPGTMGPFGSGVSEGTLLMPGTRVFVLKTATTSYVNMGYASPVLPIICVDNEVPAKDTYYYPPWRMTQYRGVSVDGRGIDEAVSQYSGFPLTDRLRGKPLDMNPGEWMVGNPMDGFLHVGGARLGMEASPVASLHMYPMESAVVFNKGVEYVEDQPWRRSGERLDVDGRPLLYRHGADSVAEAMGRENPEDPYLKPQVDERLDVSPDTQIDVEDRPARWSTLCYGGRSVGGSISQRVVKRDRNGNAQPGSFTFEGVDGSRVIGSAHSLTLSRTADLPYIEYLRELDSLEQEEDAVGTPEADATTDTWREYPALYASLMYEMAVKRFTERYWANLKARRRDWKAQSGEETAESLGRSPSQEAGSRLDPDKPAYDRKPLEVDDPLREAKMKLAALESHIHFSPTGAIILSDDAGSEIRMEGGNIVLSPAADIRIQPGRDAVMTIPRFLSMFSGERIDMASDRGEIDVHSALNLTLSAEGVATVESRGTERVASADYDKRGDGGSGVVIRSATDAHFLGHNVRLALLGQNDRSKQTTAPVSDGLLSIEAGDSPVALHGRTVSAHGDMDVSVNAGRDGTGFMASEGGVAMTGTTMVLPVKNVFFGGGATAKWIDIANSRVETRSVSAPDRVNVLVDGNVTAYQNVAGQSVTASRGLFRALSSFSGRETESLFVPGKMKGKYQEYINIYEEASKAPSDMTVDGSESYVSKWASANSGNPLLTADGVRRLGVYYPKAEDYHQAGSFWVMSKWQRALAGSGGVWTPTPVKDADGNGMLPLPGLDGWQTLDFGRSWNAQGEDDNGPLSGRWPVNC